MLIQGARSRNPCCMAHDVAWLMKSCSLPSWQPQDAEWGNFVCSCLALLERAQCAPLICLRPTGHDRPLPAPAPPDWLKMCPSPHLQPMSGWLDVMTGLHYQHVKPKTASRAFATSLKRERKQVGNQKVPYKPIYANGLASQFISQRAKR